MTVPLKKLDDQVIVITGATSGIGLATAQMAAAAGARVVLAARNREALDEVRQRIADRGGRAASVVADVGHRDEVEHIANEAIRQFGGFDTWVNNAAVGIWGRLEQTTDDDNRRLFETNFWGVVYGSVTAARHLKQRGGALINIGSVLSEVAVPLQGMYVASKFAVKGFTESLRMELLQERAPVSVTLIYPSSIDTPFPQHARNYFHQEPKLPPPVYTPDEVASAILHAATHPERDIYVGGGGRMWSGLGRHLPGAMDWIGARVMPKELLRDELARDPAGSLHQAGHDGLIRGDHPGYVHKTSLYTRAVRHPVLAGLLVLGAGVVVGQLLGVGSNGHDHS